MTGSILIEGLRNIKRLEFDLPNLGVWILTAGNGAGKTSLLACIRRIGQPNAFQFHFPVSNESIILDNYDEANISYIINDERVDYAYRGERWTPRPRTNNRLLQQFGYPEVLYIGATADRITPRPEDFKPRRVRIASQAMRRDMNEIFETDKFQHLHTINIKTGSGNEVFLLKTGENQYHSEKQFSLGELCVLKLLRNIGDCPNQSLMLIDELEIALHPRAQIRLFFYLTEVAKKKRLTIIFSTHSVSLIKAAPHSQIIFLDRDEDGNVTPVVGCFPAYAIGRITLGEESAPDVVFYVEDDVAYNVLTPLSKLVMQQKYAHSDHLFPSLKIVPIGSFVNVVRFLTQHGALLPSGTKAFAFLDQDVKSETVANWKANENYANLEKFKNLANQIIYLPWTPEVGIIDFFAANRVAVETELKRVFSSPRISLSRNHLNGLQGLSGKAARSRAKRIYSDICQEISTISAKSPEHVEDKVCELFAVMYFAKHKAQIMALLAPKL